jgi:hypothetical protein
MATVSTKQCNKCKKRRNVKHFHLDMAKKDGLRGECKSCRAIAIKAVNKTKKATYLGAQYY